MVDVSLWRQDHLSWLWQLTEHPVINVPSSALPVLRCVHPSFRILSPWGPGCGGRQLHGTQPNDSSLACGWKTWWRVQQKVALAMCCVLWGPGTDFLPHTSFVSHVPRCYLFKKYFSTFQPRLDRRAHTHHGSLRWVDQLPRRKGNRLFFPIRHAKQTCCLHPQAQSESDANSSSVSWLTSCQRFISSRGGRRYQTAAASQPHFLSLNGLCLLCQLSAQKVSRLFERSCSQTCSRPHCHKARHRGFLDCA